MPEEHQRQPCRVLGEALEHHQAGDIRPLEVVHGDDEGRVAAELVDESADAVEYAELQM